MGENWTYTSKDLTWKRASDHAFFGKTHSLFGDGISVDDITQGSLGNCWFLAAASALAEEPGRLEKIFVNTDSALNDNGIYGVNFYALGVPHTVVVDDYLPVQ